MPTLKSSNQTHKQMGTSELITVKRKEEAELVVQYSHPVCNWMLRTSHFGRSQAEEEIKTRTFNLSNYSKILEPYLHVPIIFRD